ncbi:MAG: bifunctional nuclease family protein [Deltaproteobacteria bacterium]|nr:MAG: bifunctional nuclease family protein [Deltaproteobacteria bacterium]
MLPSAHLARSLAVLLLLGAACRPSDEYVGPLVPASGDGTAEIAVHVDRVAFDPGSGSPVVLLAEDGGSRVLPILIPVAAAHSIASEMSRITPMRPNTHDLAKSLLDRLEGRVERIVVTELRSGTFYAVIVVGVDGRQMQVDARPSDAIAIALRAKAPLFVLEAVFEQAGEDPEMDGEEVRADARAPAARQCATPPATAAGTRAPRATVCAACA